MNPIHIAIAEDHAILRQTVKTFLSQTNNIEVVIEASNGLELLNLLKSRKVDVIILDIQMPVLNGIDTLITLRQTDRHTKVIMFSTHNDVFTIRDLCRIGINSFVSKSCSEILPTTILEVYHKGISYNADFKPDQF